jgi:transcriptional regulator with XRE-family HTH domain
MPKTDEFFLYFANALTPTAPQGGVVVDEEDPNEASAVEIIRAGGHEAIYERSFLVAKLGELLRFARKQQRLSQIDAAARGELSQAHISRLENGLAVNGPTFESLVAYLQGIGFDVELSVRSKENGEELARLGSRAVESEEFGTGSMPGGGTFRRRRKQLFDREFGRPRYHINRDDDSEV